MLFSTSIREASLCSEWQSIHKLMTTQGTNKTWHNKTYIPPSLRFREHGKREIKNNVRDKRQGEEL